MKITQENIDRELTQATNKAIHYIEVHVPVGEVALDLVMALVAMQELVDFQRGVSYRTQVLENIYARYPMIKEHIQRVARAEKVKEGAHGPS